MRRIIAFDMISLDGFFEGTKPGDIDFHHVDEEFNDFALDQLSTAGGLIFGRVTYEGMASFWPSPLALEIDPHIAQVMNTIPKIVFSTTLDEAAWHNTRLIKDDVASHVTTLKSQPGKDLFIFGSAKLTASFLNLGLIDELRIMVNPVLLGAGNPLFRDLHNRTELKLTQARTFKNGNVLLYYSLESA